MHLIESAQLIEVKVETTKKTGNEVAVFTKQETQGKGGRERLQ